MHCRRRPLGTSVSYYKRHPFLLLRAYEPWRADHGDHCIGRDEHGGSRLIAKGSAQVRVQPHKCQKHCDRNPQPRASITGASLPFVFPFAFAMPAMAIWRKRSLLRRRLLSLCKVRNIAFAPATPLRAELFRLKVCVIASSLFDSSGRSRENADGQGIPVRRYRRLK